MKTPIPWKELMRSTVRRRESNNATRTKDTEPFKVAKDYYIFFIVAEAR